MNRFLASPFAEDVRRAMPLLSLGVVVLLLAHALAGLVVPGMGLGFWGWVW